jgi:hypothetical protein
VANAIALLECDDYSFFIFCGYDPIYVKVINDEREGR